ncbi:MAG: hypothetical protein QOD60_2362 [Solirubrobacterales bacterium]|nr:hypothetical protein [Solirubrobacterales bacterium]
MSTSSVADYLQGLIELGVLFAAIGFGAMRLRRRLLPGWAGAVARLAEIVLGLGILVLTLEIVGVVGLYHPGWVLVVGIAAGLGIGLAATPRGEGIGPPSPEVSLFLLALTTVAATAVAAHWAFPTQAGLDHGMYLPNSTWHNMPFAARFVQDHTVGGLLFTEPLKLSVWFYPQNSELLHSAGILFMQNDFLSPLINMGWLAGCLLAAWCIGRPYAVGATALIGVGLILDENMLLLYQPGDAKNDVMGLFFFLAAAAILINGEAERRRATSTADSSASREERGPFGLPRFSRFGTGPLLVASLAAGLSLGTKINMLAPLGALTIGVIVVSLPTERVRTALYWAGGLIAGGGFWFIRNALNSSGNPLPWIHPGPIPGPDQLDIYVRRPHTVADYIFNSSVIKNYFFPGLNNDFGPLWPAVLALILGGIIFVVWRAETPTVRMLGVVAGFAAVAYLFTPLTAAGNAGAPTGFERNVRYFAPALMLGIAILPLLPDLRKGRRPYILLAIVVALLAESLITSNQWDNIGYRPGAVSLAILLIAVPVVATLLLQRRFPIILVVAGVLVALAGGTVYGHEREKDYLNGRYRVDTVPDQIPLGIPQAMGITNGLKDQHIALGGSTTGFKQYLFYGRDLSNRVQYIGDRGSNGTFRPITECAEFRRALNDGHYNYLITAPPHINLNIPPPETTWVESDPNSQLVETFFGTSVYKLTGPLDPAGCEKLTPAQRTGDPLLGATH